MRENRYKVLMNQEIVARDMDIKTAIILVKALFEEYYLVHNMTISVKEEDRVEKIDERDYIR